MEKPKRMSSALEATLAMISRSLAGSVLGQRALSERSIRITVAFSGV